MFLYLIFLPGQNEPVKEFFDYAINQFQEQNPNVNFEVFSYFNVEYEQKINMLLASENHPDIFLVKAGNLGNQIISKGQALNLTQYYEKDSYWADKIISSTVKPFTHDNQICGVPFTTNVGMLAYNKEIFDELNLEVPETWDEFIEILKILNKKRIYSSGLQ